MKKLTLLLSFACLGFIANAQSYYYLKHFYKPGNPKGLNTEDDNVTTGWTVLSSTSATPSYSANQNLPFAFSFNNAPVTSYKVSTTGYLTFETSSTAAANAATSALPNSGLPANTIAIGGFNCSGTNDQVLLKTFGTAPNRQMWVRYLSATTPGNATSFTYYAIVLEETTNKIYIVKQFYGESNGVYVSPNSNIGIQIDSANVTKVTPAPQTNDPATANWNTAAASDNDYYEFVYGTKPTNLANAISFNIETRLSAANSPFAITGNLLNLGSSAITNYRINYSVNNGTAVSSVVTANISENGSASYTHPTPWAQTTGGAYTIKVWIDQVNGIDVAPADIAYLTKNVNLFTSLTDKKVLHEIFTSSTCPPCNPGNANLTSVLNDKLGKWNVIKYQVNFPGTGDPYYTSEVANRFSYYGASFAPWLTVDGAWNDNANSYTGGIFDGFYAQKTPFTLAATQTVSNGGKTIDISGTATASGTIATGNYKIRIAVIERMTYKNIKTNGETEFHNVMKKMLPNATGTAVSFASSTTANFSGTWTVPGTYRLPSDGQAANIINLATENSVENLGALSAIVFIQDDNTKEVLQSVATSGVFPLGLSNLDAMNVEVYPNPASQNFNVKLTDAKKGSLTIRSIDGKVVKTVTLNELDNNIDCADLINGIYMVELTVGDKTAMEKLVIAK